MSFDQIGSLWKMVGEFTNGDFGHHRRYISLKQVADSQNGLVVFKQRASANAAVVEQHYHSINYSFNLWMHHSVLLVDVHEKHLPADAEVSLCYGEGQSICLLAVFTQDSAQLGWAVSLFLLNKVKVVLFDLVAVAAQTRSHSLCCFHPHWRTPSDLIYFVLFACSHHLFCTDRVNLVNCYPLSLLLLLNSALYFPKQGNETMMVQGTHHPPKITFDLPLPMSHDKAMWMMLLFNHSKSIKAAHVLHHGQRADFKGVDRASVGVDDPNAHSDVYNTLE